MATRSATLLVLAISALAAAVVAPLALADNLPFVDYPNHLARQYILQTLGQSEDLARYYSTKDGFYPYWAIRLVVGLLGPVTGIDAAGRIFAILAMLMPVAGALAISRAVHSRITLPALAAFAFAYNEPMAWGFQNYMLSAGVAMIAFAIWIKAADWRGWQRMGIFALVALGLASLHLLAAGVFAGLALAWELGGILTDRRWREASAYSKIGEIMLIMLPTAMLAAVLSGEDIGITNTIFGGLQLRFTGLVSVLWMGWDKFDLLLGVWLVCLLASALWLRVLNIPAKFRWFLALLALATIAAPFAVVGVTFVNMRLPLIVCLVFIACCDVRKPRARTAMVFATVLVALAAVKFCLVATGLAARSVQISELRAAIVQIEPGQRLFSAIDSEAATARPELSQEFYRQIISYAVIDRQAFVPRLFTMYEVGLTGATASLGRPVSDPIDLVLLSQDFSNWPEAGKHPLEYARYWQQDYDYMLLIDFGGDPNLPEGLQVVHRGSYFRLLKITHNDAG